ncbi:MAG: S8/S53 family peptidase, partial [Gammaproteobacteria bacterium]|nr:S8/S53 family peptidase [Gammaproteobacteria bacterium]
MQRYYFVFLLLFWALSGCGGGSSSSGASSDNVTITAEDQLQGDPQSPAVDSVPAYFPNPPQASDYKVATADGLVKGMEIHVSRLVVKINPSSTTDEVNKLFASIPVKVSGSAGAGLIYVDLLDGSTQEDLVNARNILQASPLIDVAVEDILIDFQEGGESAGLDPSGCEDTKEPVDSEWTGTYFGGVGNRAWEKTEYSGNWWIEFIRMPAAWNFNDAIKRQALLENKSPEELLPPIGVVDAGFQSHIDIPYARKDRSSLSCHGNMVAGIISATHDKYQADAAGKGVEGIHPFARIMDSPVSVDYGGSDLIRRVSSTFIQQAVALSALLEFNPLTRVVNVSMGFNWDRCFENNTCDHPQNIPEAEIVLKKYAELTWHLIKNYDVLIVAAAGNSSMFVDDYPWDDVPAKWLSPLNYLALEGIEDESGNHFKAENILVVEGVNWQGRGGRRNFTSSTGGQISAPGACMTSTAQNGAYASANGTSFAAPIVTGLAGYLWTIDPLLTVSEVKNIIVSTGNLPAESLNFDMSVTPGAYTGPNLEFISLCEAGDLTASPNEPDQPPIVDAFSAVMSLDRAVEMLVDADDGTVDGVTVTGDGANTALPGDGQIDMADFRAFRDAVAQFKLGELSRNLEQPSHIKRDNNRDGCVYDGLYCLVKEEIWSRFDFNGDGRLSDFDQVEIYLPGDVRDQPALQRTDLDVLGSVWPGPDDNWDLHCANTKNSLTDGWCAEDLQDLLNSRDIVVDFSSFAPAQDEKITVAISIGNHYRSREMFFDADSEPRMVFTVPWDYE